MSLGVISRGALGINPPTLPYPQKKTAQSRFLFHGSTLWFQIEIWEKKNIYIWPFQHGNHKVSEIKQDWIRLDLFSEMCWIVCFFFGKWRDSRGIFHILNFFRTKNCFSSNLLVVIRIIFVFFLSATSWNLIEMLLKRTHLQCTWHRKKTAHLNNY